MKKLIIKNRILILLILLIKISFILNFIIIYSNLYKAKDNKKENNLENFYDVKNLDNKKNLIYLAILGSGPAGFSAAICGARSGMHSVIFSGPNPRGQLKDGILVENWPGVAKDSGDNIMKNLEKQTKDFGAIISNDTIKEVDFSSWPFKLYGQNKLYNAMSVIITTGATPKKLGVKNEDIYWLKGILSCPLCDAHLIKNKHAVVIGGGDSAVERILQLAPYAKNITLILRSEKIRAIYDMYKKIKNIPNVKILFNKDIEEFVGNPDNKNQHLAGIKIKDTKTGEKDFIKTKWVFLAIGFEPNSHIFKNKIDLDKNGYITHDCATQEVKINNKNIKGLYTAGNVCDSNYKQAVTASGDATKAAYNAFRFVNDILSNINKDKIKNLKKNLYFPRKKNYIKVQAINSDQIDKIINSNKLVLIEFYSPLCSLCKSIENLVSFIAYKYKDKIKIYKVDILKNKDLLKKYSISLVPEFLFFKDTKILNRISKEINQSILINFIEKNLK